MRVKLIYNPNARQTGEVAPDALLAALRATGCHVLHHPTEEVSDLDGILATDDMDLVVTVGGDGTVRAVATRLLFRDIPILPLPMGTANNIARSLGVEGDPLTLIAGLREGTPRPFDVGQVTGPWGKEYFLEAMGVGFYADALDAYEPDKPKSVLRALRALGETLPDPQTHRFRARLDGVDISGAYLMLEVLNTEAFGPRLAIAPAANTSDGRFEVMLVRDSETVTVVNYLAALVAGEFPEIPSVTATQGRRLVLQWTGYPLHIDGFLFRHRSDGDAGSRRDTDDRATTVTVDVLYHALHFWIPKASADAESGLF
jgi:diacylglycerol kinase family enzyme